MTRPPDPQDPFEDDSAAQRSGYIPHVARPPHAAGEPLPPGRTAAPYPAGEAPPWEDRPTAAMPILRGGTAGSPSPAPAPPPPVSYVPSGGQRSVTPAPGYRPPPAPLAPVAPVEYVQPSPPRPSTARPATGGNRTPAAPVYDPTRAQVAVVPEGRPTRRGHGALFGVLAGLLVLAGIGLFAAAGWYEQQYAGRMFPGVRVYGVDLGGKSTDEARVLLENRVAGFANQPLDLVWSDQHWNPPPSQLGMQINLDRTLDNAYAVGRTGGLLDLWRDRWAVANEGRVVPLAVTLDESKLQSYLQTEVAPKTDQDLQEGDVWLQGEQVKSSPAQEGHSLQVYLALQTIRNSLARMAGNNRIELPVTVSKPSVPQAELDATAKQLQTMLAAPLVAQHAGKQFAVDPRKISQKLLLLKRNADPAAAKHFEVAFQEENLKAAVADWADQLDTAPQNARFAWNNGQVQVIKESQDGVKVNQEKAIAAVKAALLTPDKRTVELPTDTRLPKVSSKDIGALGIKELLGTGNTSFKGSSAERATNIKVAAGFLEGVVVPPGDTFSFLDAVAPITLDRGYVEGYVIAAERTQRGVGGGVCQVSTTVFRAAFWSAVDITERHQHAYRVSWYESKGEPVGFDAAVFDPGVDFKFVNNTPGFLLVQSVLTGDELNVNFYGTKTADEVKLVGPQIEKQLNPPQDIYQLDPTLPAGSKKQVETAHKGLDTTITRQIYKGGQLGGEDPFFSHYQAWPNWFLVAPGVSTPYPPRPPDPPSTP